MGFTVYWSRQPVMNDVFQRFKTLLPDMLEHSTLQDSVSEVILVPTDDTDQPERFWTRESSSGFAFAKTSRTPYTTDVMRACILMAELGMVTLESLSNDDEEAFPWLEQLKAVNRYLPLKIYEELSVVFDDVSLTNDIKHLEGEIKFLKALIKGAEAKKGLSDKA
jgi:hypothetical protein